jgi:HAMP domain-containing protein
MAGDAAWRASLRGARGDLRRLRELEREVKAQRLDRATAKARLREIEERKKAVKAAASGRK